MSFKVAFYTWLARVLDPRGAAAADRIIARLKEIERQQ